MSGADVVDSRFEMPVTSLTLIGGLRRPEDVEVYQAAWLRFHRTYSPVIFRWFRNNGRLDNEAAQEATQAFHVRLVENVREFEYDPAKTFRGWLRVCVRNHLLNFIRDRKKQLHLADGMDWMNAAESLDERLQRMFDLELWQAARKKVRGDVSSRDWKIYEATVEGDESDPDVSERLAVSIGVIHTAKWRVKKKLADEVKRLESRGVSDDSG